MAIAGALLIRAFDRSVKVGNAMVSRGYTGKYNLFTIEKKKLPKKDAFVGALIIAASISMVLVDAFVLRGVHFGQYSFKYSINDKLERKKLKSIRNNQPVLHLSRWNKSTKQPKFQRRKRRKHGNPWPKRCRQIHFAPSFQRATDDLVQAKLLS